MKISITIFWVVTTCGLVDACQCFRGMYCIHLHDEASWKQRQYIPPKWWSPSSSSHAITTLKTMITRSHNGR
jgi:hypothetical protein